MSTKPNHAGAYHRQLSQAVTHRGPITYIDNGKGSRPWLPETLMEPGWIYLVNKPLDDNTIRCCWRCALELGVIHDGRSSTFFEDNPPAADDRCSRCERSYGERGDATRLG